MACDSCDYTTQDNKRAGRHEKDTSHHMNIVSGEIDGVNVTTHDLPMDGDCVRFCSQCKFRSTDDNECISHEKETDHKVLRRLRNRINVTIRTQTNTFNINVTNVDRKNFSPCEVRLTMGKMSRDLLRRYSGAVTQITGDYMMDIDSFYDNKKTLKNI